MVLRNRKVEVFLNKEDQIVIEQQFNAKLRTRMFLQLILFILFLASVTWLGMQMTTRDAESGFMMSQGILSKVCPFKNTLLMAPCLIVSAFTWNMVVCMSQLSTNEFFDDTGPPGTPYPVQIKSFSTIDADHDDFYLWCHHILPGKRVAGFLTAVSTCPTLWFEFLLPRQTHYIADMPAGHRLAQI